MQARYESSPRETAGMNTKEQKENGKIILTTAKPKPANLLYKIMVTKRIIKTLRSEHCRMISYSPQYCLLVIAVLRISF